MAETSHPSRWAGYAWSSAWWNPDYGTAGADQFHRVAARRSDTAASTPHRCRNESDHPELGTHHHDQGAEQGGGAIKVLVQDGWHAADHHVAQGAAADGRQQAKDEHTEHVQARHRDPGQRAIDGKRQCAPEVEDEQQGGAGHEGRHAA